MPAAGETLYVYRLVEVKGNCHLRPGGYYPIADYALYATQPSQEVLCSPMGWAAWMRAEVEKLTPTEATCEK